MNSLFVPTISYSSFLKSGFHMYYSRVLGLRFRNFNEINKLLFLKKKLWTPVHFLKILNSSNFQSSMLFKLQALLISQTTLFIKFAIAKSFAFSTSLEAFYYSNFKFICSSFLHSREKESWLPGDSSLLKCPQWPELG